MKTYTNINWRNAAQCEMRYILKIKTIIQKNLTHKLQDFSILNLYTQKWASQIVATDSNNRQRPNTEHITNAKRKRNLNLKEGGWEKSLLTLEAKKGNSVIFDWTYVHSTIFCTPFKRFKHGSTNIAPTYLYNKCNIIKPP